MCFLSGEMLANNPVVWRRVTGLVFHRSEEPTTNRRGLSAQIVTYINSDVDLCCYPSVISFSRREDAERFKQGFAGEMVDFYCAQDKIRGMMEL
jgi:hypothetical protein